MVGYFLFDPASSSFFPKCPFSRPRLKCPGCGSQRAIHALLHLQVGRAFSENPLMVISIPYLLTAFDFLKRRNEKWQAATFSGQAVKLVLVTFNE
ncbi:MAG: DUF2752 domain-containing protein [Saprospiraceae bacterium]|nr:DUF2752 domain-containing protein [Saprospiraceae bacterium]